MTDCARCGQNHYDTSRPTVPACPFKPQPLGPSMDAETCASLAEWDGKPPLTPYGEALERVRALEGALEEILPIAESYFYIVPDRRGSGVAKLERARRLLGLPTDPAVE